MTSLKATMKNKGLSIAVVAILTAALIWLAFFWTPAPQPTSKPLPGQSALAAPPAGGDFVLRGPTGPVALKDYRGKVVLVYFGYTYCPDVCPTSLAIIAQALSSLTAAERERVQGIFVSVDPERDSLDRLKEYAPFFHPNIVGSSGSPEQVAAVAKQYGASYARQKADAGGNYVVDHSSVTYVVGPDGTLAAALPHATPPEQIARTVRGLLGTAGKRS